MAGLVKNIQLHLLPVSSDEFSLDAVYVCEFHKPHRLSFMVYAADSAYILLLEVRVERSRNLTLGSVMDKFMNHLRTSALVKQALEGSHVLSWKHVRFLHRQGENLVQDVNPLAALLLGHIEAFTKVFLCGIVLEIDKYEEQAFRDRRKRTVGLDHLSALTRQFLSLDIVPAEIFVMGIGEKWQNLVKKSYADTCQCHKTGRIGAYLGVVHTLYNEIPSRVCA